MATSGFRISQIDTFSSSSITTILNDRTNLITGSSGNNLSRVWGVMTPYGAVTSGSINLLDGGTIKLETLIPGETYPVYPSSIKVTLGTAYILS